jgi:hypothetical protein
MLMKLGDRWHCTNPECHLTVLVESCGKIEGSNPRCPCGSVMKKQYHSPVFSYLDFLRVDEEPIGTRESEE